MAKIEKNMIEALLARPTSKQVLAFEGVFLEDLNDYVKWALDYLHNGRSPAFVEFAFWRAFN